MKIAILGSRGIPANYGGFETFAEELSTRLSAKGEKVAVYCESRSGEKLTVYKGVKLVYISSPKLGPFTTIFFDLFCLWHARKAYDAVYMLGYGASLFCFIPRLWGTKVWINMDGIEWKRAKWGFIAKAYFKLMEYIAVRIADWIIADAESIKQFLLYRHSIMAPCSVIPYGAPVVENAPASVLSDYGLKPHDYYLVVCRMEPENHVLEILQGFTSSTSSRRLIIVGNHLTDIAYVRKLKLICDNRIEFVGDIYDRGKLSTLRYYCRAYIHGHSVGGSNPSLLEALGCGNLVIAHDNEFNREVAGEIGAYFRTSSDIARCVERVDMMETADRNMLSIAAQKRIQDRYNWDIITDQYCEILYKQKPISEFNGVPPSEV